MGLSVSSTYPFEGVFYCVCGVNVINGAKISEEKLNEQAFITTDLEAVLNINTLNDLEIAQKIMRRIRKGQSVCGQYVVRFRFLRLLFLSICFKLAEETANSEDVRFGVGSNFYCAVVASYVALHAFGASV